MFGSSDTGKETKKKSVTNNQRNEIAHGTKIVGDIHFPGTVRFDGEIDGNITCESKIVVGNKGVVNGNVKSNEVEVSGEINGNVNASEFLYLTSSAKINGDVEYKKIQIDPEGAINGKMSISGSAPKASSSKPNNQKVGA